MDQIKMDKPTNIAAQWDSYVGAVIPPGAGPGQIRDLRMAFFGGARAMLTEIVAGVDADSYPSTASAYILQRILTLTAEMDQYLTDFIKEIKNLNGPTK